VIFQRGQNAPRGCTSSRQATSTGTASFESGDTIDSTNSSDRPRPLRATCGANDDTLDFIAEVRDRSHRAERIGKAFPAGIESPAFTSLLKVSLYPYQREGAIFAARAGRSLIADDMGLGKTIQAIARVKSSPRWRGSSGPDRLSHVVKYQWKQEIEKFCDHSAAVVEGTLARRADLYAQDSFFKIIKTMTWCTGMPMPSASGA